ncbi:DUF6519 domain-containing protein [Falsiroseomonas sp.]|uniref:DUF6519 domain-containing protein n=1 Tax=Falsiroseomonas sp. TaxID=2870721 RepID=UPI0027351128|nr:DUF6519 domain-containing protein [Falsiroseomonas sp.]MDP3417840.1 DUF6519 domain-containing protein [Falsiroseomonas sp.]
MTGDFTRNGFRPDRHYTTLRLQQGRVLLDADWNEQADIARWHERQANADLAGPSGFPEDAAGFALAPIPGDLLIAPGRGYVAGRLLVNPGPARVALQPVSGSGAGALWRITGGARLRARQAMLVPGTVQRVTVTELGEDAAGRQQAKFSAALPAGTAELLAEASVASQPHLAPAPLPAAAGSYLAYLEVWERPVGTLEDPAIREEALGGPDTAAREQMIWQVKLRATADIPGSAGPLPAAPACSDIADDWMPEAAPKARLVAIAEAGPGEEGPCALPAAGGYRSLENHLYRVEIHHGGMVGGGTPRLKWSRDNAMHRARLTGLDNGVLLVDSPGHDAATAFRTGDWLEVLDEARVLAGAPGFFVQIAEVNGNRLAVAKLLDPASLTELTKNGQPDTDLLAGSTELRRWEGGRPMDIAADAPVKLENGVAVRISAGALRSGDHWTIPARSITADLIWPRDPASGAPLSVPPEGVARHFCKLAILAHDGAGNWSVLDDCRPLFPPLTGLAALSYLGGDAQEAVPDPAAPAALLPLAHPLAAGVARGGTPVEGARVRFRILSGNGRFDDGSVDRVVETLADGRAETGWTPGSTTLHQRVEARLLDGADPAHLAVTFSARLSRAAEVAFDPANCPPLAGDRTVQKAIERLCQRQSAGCATYVLSPDSDWRAVLAGLKPGEDAHICFRAGEYKADRMVVLKGLGHIILSGAGEGSRLLAEGECALHVLDCASLHVHGLAFLAPRPGERDAPEADLNGALTVTRVAQVEVADCTLLTAAATSRARAALRIRQTERGRADGQTRRVLVRDNRVLIGENQIGILVDDAAIAIVEDNEIAAFGEVGEEAAERPEVKKALAQRLMRAPVTGLPDPEAPSERRLDAGRFVARFTSAVSEEDWKRAMRATRPEADELVDEAGFARYLRRLGAAMAEDAGGDARRLPSLDRAVATLRLGTAGNATREAIGRLVLPEDEIKVAPLTAAELGRDVVLTVGPHRVAFDSVLTEAEWRGILALAGSAGLRSDEELRELVERTAERLVEDRAFRERSPAARDFHARATRRREASAGHGIVCAGSRLDEVRVRGNSLDGVAEGIRIAVSHSAARGDPPDIVGSLDVSGNRIALRLPPDRMHGQQAVQIGNARRAVISRNEVTYPEAERGQVYVVGIDMIGVYGPFVLVAENIVEVTPGTMRCAIRVQPVGSDPARASVLWRAVGNLAIGFSDNAFQFHRAFRETENLML